MPKTKKCDGCGAALEECSCNDNSGACFDCGCDPCGCGDPCEGCGLDECECESEGDETPSLFAPSEQPAQDNLRPQWDREQWLRTHARQQELIDNPALIAAALPAFNALLDEYDACIRADDWEAAHRVNDRADAFASELQGGDGCGILAPEGAGKLLELAAAAPDGTLPNWGQCGNFVIQVGLTLVRVEYDGIFGYGFSIHAVKWDRPFPSETGYRSFAGVWPTAVKLGSSVADWVKWNVEEYIKRECKKGLPFIRFEHQERHANDPLNSLPVVNTPPVDAPPVRVEPVEPPAAPVAPVCLYEPVRGGSQLSLFA